MPFYNGYYIVRNYRELEIIIVHTIFTLIRLKNNMEYFFYLFILELKKRNTQICKHNF